MKHRTQSVLAVLATVVMIAVQFSEGAAEDSAGKQALARLKSLAGRWEGTTSTGKKAVMTYEVVSGGTAVLERYAPSGSEGMVTLYTLDGDDLVLTHYCIANNQPRMRLTRHSADWSRLEFEFVSGGNLADLNQGHMYKAVFVWRDADHLENTWTYREGLKDKFAVTTALARIR